MATNNSNRQQTVNKTLNAMKSDVWQIDNLMVLQNYENVVLIQDELLLDRYYDDFLPLLEESEVDKKFYQSPEMFANAYYGTADLAFLVIYFAGMKDRFDFTKPKIKVLPPEYLAEINRIMVKFKNEIKESNKII